jgi:hypothetical protein
LSAGFFRDQQSIGHKLVYDSRGEGTDSDDPRLLMVAVPLH